MRALVTGGAGFIGSNLALELEKKGNEVIVLDNFYTSNKENLTGFNGQIINEDILDVNINNIKPDIIFHQAAITSYLIEDKDLVYKVNINGFKRLLDYSVKNNIPFIYASSAAVYGHLKPPQKEYIVDIPNNAYAKSKLENDNLALKYMKKYKSLIIGLRYFNVFGPREKFKGKLASMIFKLMLQMMDGKNPRVFKYGEQKRDHIYINDVVDATIKSTKLKESKIYNVGTGVYTTFNELIKILNKVLGTDLKTEYIDNPYKQFYQNHTQADITKIKNDLKWKPGYNIKAGIKDYIKWLKKQD